MFHVLAKKIMHSYSEKNMFKEDDEEIYVFGLNQLLTYLVNIITILFVGLVFGEVIEGIILTLSFVILRTYAGGYHATTPIKCFIGTVLILSLNLAIIKFVKLSSVVCLIVSIISGLIILLLAPMGCENKDLDQIEKVIYRKKVKVVWGIEFCIGVILLVLKCTTISKCIMLAHLTECISLILEAKSEKNKRCHIRC